MRWTTRLRRNGGMTAILVRRGQQFAALQAVHPFARGAAVAKEALEWLAGNPLRVMNAAEERFFGVTRVVAP